MPGVRFIQFEHNPNFAPYARTWVKDFFDILGNQFVIGRITPQGCMFQSYSPRLERYEYANYLAVNRDENRTQIDVIDYFAAY